MFRVHNTHRKASLSLKKIKKKMICNLYMIALWESGKLDTCVMFCKDQFHTQSRFAYG